VNVFVTGIAGVIGEAVAKAFLEVGYPVRGLVGDSSSHERLHRMGAVPIMGDLADASTYEAVAGAHDVVVHAGMDRTRAFPQTDRKVIETLVAACRGAARPRSLIYTSSTWVLGDTGTCLADENTAVAKPASFLSWLPDHENEVLSSANELLATAVVRPGLVYGDRRGLLSHYFESASSTGRASLVGNGLNFHSLIHRDDLGRLYKAVAQQRRRGIFHGVDAAPLHAREVAEAISRAVGSGDKASKTIQKAQSLLGPEAEVLALNQRVGRSRACSLGWEPQYRSFFDGLGPTVRTWAGAAMRPAGISARFRSFFRDFEDGPEIWKGV
jgi:nucleoside-diphosphate-sugar epimerase